MNPAPLGDMSFAVVPVLAAKLFLLPIRDLLCSSPFRLRTETSSDETISDQSVGKTHPRPFCGKSCDKLMRYSPSVFPTESHASALAAQPQCAWCRLTLIRAGISLGGRPASRPTSRWGLSCLSPVLRFSGEEPPRHIGS